VHQRRQVILKGIRGLEGVYIMKTVLGMGINDKLHQVKNFLIQVESHSQNETRVRVRRQVYIVVKVQKVLVREASSKRTPDRT
jgi:hypothetical protein